MREQEVKQPFTLEFPKSTNPKTRKYAQDTLALFQQLPTYKPCSQGRFSIEEEVKRVGASIPIVSFRQALFEGSKLQPISIKCQEDVVIHKLVDKDNGVWMSTLPQELGQMLSVLKSAKGKVLVGGLGLGVITHLLQQLPKVKVVSTVEIESDLIELIFQYIDTNKSIFLNMDLHSFLKDVPSKAYDFAFFDIWQGTGEWTWQTQVVPLRRLARNKIKRVMCWQENEMQGQVLRGMWLQVSFPVEFYKASQSTSTAHYYPIAAVAQQKGLIEGVDPEKLLKASFMETERQNQANYDLVLLATIYVTQVGTDLWENLFGRYWDETLSWYEKVVMDND